MFEQRVCTEKGREKQIRQSWPVFLLLRCPSWPQPAGSSASVEGEGGGTGSGRQAGSVGLCSWKLLLLLSSSASQALSSMGGAAQNAALHRAG